MSERSLDINLEILNLNKFQFLFNEKNRIDNELKKLIIKGCISEIKKYIGLHLYQYTQGFYGEQCLTNCQNNYKTNEFLQKQIHTYILENTPYEWIHEFSNTQYVENFILYELITKVILEMNHIDNYEKFYPHIKFETSNNFDNTEKYKCICNVNFNQLVTIENEIDLCKEIAKIIVGFHNVIKTEIEENFVEKVIFTPISHSILYDQNDKNNIIGVEYISHYKFE